MTPSQKEQQIISRLGLIEDTHERLAAVVDRVRKLPPLTDAERVESNRVQGCISRVWVVAAIENDRCTFRVDTDSTLVRGLAALICDVYDGSTAADVAEHETQILGLLNLSDHLSPTRRNGLEQVRKAVREFAANCLSA